MDSKRLLDMQAATIATHAGSDPERNYGIVNPPVYHASTVLFPTVADLENRTSGPDVIRYGRMGTPTTHAFEKAVAALEGGESAVTLSSGLGAITTTLLTFLKSGDHLLMTDSVYDPTRKFCEGLLTSMGIETSYYDPLIGSEIANLIRPNTRVVFCETPGSLTFEMQDIPAIAEEAHKKNCIVIMDNTWGTPLYYKSFEKGVDVSVHAATKYIVGHSDAMMGIAVAKAPYDMQIRHMAWNLGQCAAPDDCYLALRGLRSMAARLKVHHENMLHIAQWLENREEVSRLFCPALPSDPGHALWKRDFLGACGLFALELAPVRKEAWVAMLDHMELFKMGYSWGGYESLVIPFDAKAIRTATKWAPQGPCLRLHIGLEDVEDLKADLEAGFARLKENA